MRKLKPVERRIEEKQPDGTTLVYTTTDGEYALRKKQKAKRVKARDEKDPFYHNAGWFQKGYDPRRHVFTKEECQLGYAEAIDRLLYYYRIGSWRTAESIFRKNIKRS